MGHIRHLSTQRIIPLQEIWNVYLAEPGTITDPKELAASSLKPIIGEVPGTVVSAFRKAKSKTLNHRSPDDYDVWYTCCFPGETLTGSDRARLVFEGLATFADVWLNGEHLLRSDNMFLKHEVDITALMRPNNELVIRFSSLNRFLEQRRPRPQWRTHLVDHAQLRWVRTALTGRMPGWHQNAYESHAVGPWRPISLVIDHLVQVASSAIRTTLEQAEGVVRASVDIRLLEGKLTDASLFVGDHQTPLRITVNDDWGLTLDGELRLPDPALWWPHTHGEQPLYSISARLSIDDKTVEIDLGRTGFRSLSFDTGDGGFSVSLNGEKVFLRGANWNTLDASGLLADNTKCDHLLTLVRDAGMNMLRVSGTGSYESDYFYDRCAELGITLWHDFAFAVMDYPGQDEAFRESVSTEAKQILQRLQQNPALTVFCGNSECAMGAAMHGLSSEKWQNPLFDNVLAEAVEQTVPEVAFVPSSPSGGALPFQPDTGFSHYYGVGAYLKPLEDARRSHVRFAPECLGFSNIPEDETIDAYLAQGECPGRQPTWKAGVPRNVSLGWDFDDVRDHYTRTLFGEEPNAALYSDTERYLTLGRIVNGELMTGAFSEWRRPASSCKGALVWYFQDIWPGAGWGIIDSFGRPKSVYYYLKRILSPIGLFFSDEGLNGLRLHVVNERPVPLKATLRIALYRSGYTCLHQQSVPLELEPHSATDLNVDALLGYFADTTFAYRFGPPTQNVTVAVLETEESNESSRAFFYPTGPRFPQTTDIGLEAQAQRRNEGGYNLTVRAERFAQAVKIEVRGHSASDNYFHLEPGHSHTIVLTPNPDYHKPLTGYVSAANAQAQTSITVLSTESHTEAQAA